MTDDTKRLIQIDAHSLTALLKDLMEVEGRLEQIGIEEGEFYNLISYNVSGLNVFLLDHGCEDLVGAETAEGKAVPASPVIRVSCIETNVLLTSELIAYEEFMHEAHVLRFINETFSHWYAKRLQEVNDHNKTIPEGHSKGAFELDLGEWEPWTTLASDLVVTVNSAETMFIVALDKDSINRFWAAKAPDHGDEAIPRS